MIDFLVFLFIVIFGYIVIPFCVLVYALFHVSKKMTDLEYSEKICKEIKNKYNIDSKCICGHWKKEHIYHEGKCRPGFSCVCEKFSAV